MTPFTVLPLGWILFLNPIYSVVPHLTAWWLLMILPLVVIISLVYQTVRSPDGTNLLWPTFRFAFKILFYMAVICLVLQLLYYFVTTISSTPL